MKKLVLKFSYLAAMIIMLSACYPGGAEYTSDTDVILTNYNDNYDFGAKKTYFMSDSIQHIVDEGETGETKYDALILSELESNFEARGYVRLLPEDTLTHPEPPDLMVVITTIETTTTYIYGGYPWYGGWGYGWGWYYKSTKYYYGYPGYGWGYPYYPSYASSYTTGTVVWDMFDPDNVDDEGETIIVEWLGAINGLLGSSVSSTQDRIKTSINQAFTQSPYIQSN